jgi:hypothetical protein
MLLASAVASSLGHHAESDRQQHDEWIAQLRSTSSESVQRRADEEGRDRLMALMARDPKSRHVRPGLIPLVLLEGLGSVHVPVGSLAPVTTVNPELIHEILRTLELPVHATGEEE